VGPTDRVLVVGNIKIPSHNLIQVVSLYYTDMRRLTTGIRSEKCVVRRFRRCANVYLHKPRQYSMAYCTARLYGIAYCY
jgi:hypothetical protein